MNKMHYSDEAILEGIRFRSTAILEYVYEECYPLIKNLVTKNSGDAEDVQDVFQDAMVILYKKMQHEEVILQCTFKTYLYSICNHLWLQKLEKSKREDVAYKTIASLVDLAEEDLIEIYDDEAEKLRIYQRHFVQLEEECKNLLRLHIKKLTAREIADVMGFKTEKFAKVKKFRCKEDLKRRIINDPDYQKFL